MGIIGKPRLNISFKDNNAFLCLLDNFYDVAIGCITGIGKAAA
jgi:hypothetical protein